MFEIRQAVAIGTSHLANGLPCQDAVAAAATASGGAVLAVADGAGSKRLSQHGAVAAANEAVAFAVHTQASRSAEETATEATRVARRAVEKRAKELGVELGEVACTLSVAVLEESTCAIASVGDGVHMVRFEDGEIRTAAMGAETEFANLAHFLTQDDYESHLVVDAFPASGVNGIALSSDGLDGLLLYGPLDSRWVFRPAVDRLLDADGQALSRLLASDAVTKRTHDDLSVAVARRVRPSDPRERLATLSDGRVLRLGSTAVEWPGGHRAWPVTDLPGSYLVQPAERLRADAVEFIERAPQCWTPRSPLPLISWPSAVALDEERRPWSLLIRHPGGQPPTDTVAAEEPVHALHRAGHAHGALRLECFRVDPAAGATCLVDPLPAFLAGSDEAKRRRVDERFLEEARPEPRGESRSRRRWQLQGRAR